MDKKLTKVYALASMVALASGLMASPGGCGNSPLPDPAFTLPSQAELVAAAVEQDPKARGKPGHDAPSGSHWGFNIIGHPNNNFSGDDSNGRAIMIPLQTAAGTSSCEITCEDTGNTTTFTDDEAPCFETSEPTGAKIHFVSGDHFEILDRDALDNNGAMIMVPTTDAPESEITFDIYIRVLGRPNTCMSINGFAYDEQQNAYFWSGAVTLARQAGRSKFVKVNYLFDVFFCQIADCANTTQHLSVFNDVFEDYFWNILNDGVRNVQVRLYPRD